MELLRNAVGGGAGCNLHKELLPRTDRPLESPDQPPGSPKKHEQQYQQKQPPHISSF